MKILFQIQKILFEIVFKIEINTENFLRANKINVFNKGKKERKWNFENEGIKKTFYVDTKQDLKKLNNLLEFKTLSLS